ncbi:MAG: hypothetical protein RBS81_11610 [Tenuifilaceae bacterium]|jgi:hypothetical protein|nr:hypothetical protein [Tenuifilaceae bacterium]
MKILVRILFITVWFLLGFSVVVTMFGLAKAFTMELDISYTGLNLFLNVFDKYGGIYTTSFTVLGISLVVEQISLSFQANKISTRTEWKRKLDEKLDSLRNRNHYMYEHINLVADDIFDELFVTDQKVNNKEELTSLFDKYFKDVIPGYEQRSEDNIGLGDIYPQHSKSYSFKYFEEVLYRLLRPKWTYNRFYLDFRELYIAQVDLYSRDKKATESDYRRAYNDYQASKMKK